MVVSGVLVDSVVEGVVFCFGGQIGEIDSIGVYIYEVGKFVIFLIGGVELGLVIGVGVLIFLDLVGGSSDDVEVFNLVCFLLMLDEDLDSSNGIFILNVVRVVVVNWLQVNFVIVDLEVEFVLIMFDVVFVDGCIFILVDSVDVKNYLEDFIVCLVFGIFFGSFSGDDSGIYLMWI